MTAAHRRAARWQLKLAALAVASCFAGEPAHANPTGPTVASGQVSFQQAGSLLQITNSPNAIINWQSFSIGANEITRFLQQSASSAVLNRVISQNPSAILGALQSNGRVFLLNPNGILFGAGAQIDVAGLVASTLNLSDADFLAGRLKFTEVPGAGSVINQGAINAATGGQVYLVGSSVTNSGIITSPKGEVVLAAGNSVELVNPGTPNLRVEITAPDNHTFNLGQIVADAGRIGIYAGLINHSGTIRANSAVVTEDGRVVLKATRNTTLEAGSLTTANGPAGGNVTVQSGDTTLVSGIIEAKGSGDKGGTVQLFGNRVGLIENASVDASGQTGGGTVLIGGDYQGKNPLVQNASQSLIGPNVIIRADAVDSGDGGRVIVWADDINRFYGNISARGGAQSGGGGFAEVSGKNYLDFAGLVDLRAPAGAAGTLLLDPTDIRIVSTASTPTMTFGVPCGANTFCDQATTPSDLKVGALTDQLGLSSVTVNTASSLIGSGDIDVNTVVTYTSGNSLTLMANRNINVNAGNNITNNGAGAINLAAGGDLNVTSATVASSGSMAIDATNFNMFAVTAPTLVQAGTTQTVIVAGTLALQGGASGTNNSARLMAAGAGATQTISASKIALTGGGGNSNFAEIRQNGSGTQTLTAGSITLQGGASGDFNPATIITSIAAAGQVLNVGAGGLTLKGGAGTGNNQAEISSPAPQTINATGPVILTGGSLPTSFARLSSGVRVDINAAGVTENAGSFIAAPSLRLQGTGTFSLTNANQVGTLAASVTGALSYADADALTVGSVLTTDGINTSGNAATLNAGGTITVDRNVSAGTVNLAGVGVINNATIAAGAGGITINAGGGTITNNAGAVIAGSGTLTGTTFSNSGTLHPGGTGAVGTLTIVGNASFGGTGAIEIEAQGAGAGQHDVVAVTGNASLGGQLSVSNIGGYVPAQGDSLTPVTFASATGTFTVNPSGIYVETYNPINLTLVFGTIDLINRWIGTSGNWATASNWSLGHIPTDTETVRIDVPGLQMVTVSGGKRAAHMLTSNENFTITGGRLDLGGASTFNAALTLSGGSLRGAGNVVVNGDFNWKGGKLVGPGTFTTTGTSTLAPRHGSLQLKRDWINLGTVQWVARHGRDLFIREGATFLNAAGGTLNLNAGSGSDIRGEGQLINEGTINKDGGRKISIRAEFSNAGTLNVNRGTLRLKWSAGNDGVINIGRHATLDLHGHRYTNRGLIAGTGTLDVHGVRFTNDGVVAPGGAGGAGIGTLTIDGNYHQGANGVLLMDLGGTAAGQHDVLAITGKAFLGGTLSVNAVGSYVPMAGDAFRLITYRSRSGAFATTVAPAGFDLSSAYQKKFARFTLVP